MRKAGMIPYFAAAVIVILAAAAFTSWAMPRIQDDFSGGPLPAVSTVDPGDLYLEFDSEDFLIDPDEFVFNPLEEEDGLSYTGVGGSP